MMSTKRIGMIAVVVGFLVAAVAGLGLGSRSSSGPGGLSRVVVHTPQWEGETEADLTGFYWDTLRAVYEPVGIIIEPRYLSYEQSILDVRAKRCDLALGLYMNETDGVIYPRWSQEVERPVVVHPPRNTYSRAQDLVGKRSAWIRGYSYERYLPEGVDFVEVDSLREGLDLLEAGEVDYVIDYSESIESEFSRRGTDPADWVLSAIPSLSRAVYPVFRDDDRGRRLAEIYDERMNALFSDGSLQRIYDRYDRGTPMVPRSL